MLMYFYLSCLFAFPKTKNGILGFWGFGTFYFPLNSANVRCEGDGFPFKKGEPWFVGTDAAKMLGYNQ